MFGNLSLRRISGITLFFFLWMTLYPSLAAAMPQAPAPATAPQEEARKAGGDQDSLQQLHAIAKRAQEKSPGGADNGKLETQLLQRINALDKDNRQAEAEFAATARYLERQHLPEAIKQRHAKALAGYRARMKTLKQLSSRFKDAHARKEKTSTAQSLGDLADFLDKQQKSPAHQAFDPRQLPFATPAGKVRAPKEKKSELDALVHPAPVSKTAKAARAAPAQTTAPAQAPAATAAPTPGDLAPTEDVQLTGAIKDQAAALNNNPVTIYNWVRNNIEFLPTYGAIQGSGLTLANKRGNAFDTASLLIALLRAAQIPARYVYGTIQVPAEQVMNWAGGVKTPEAAQSLLGQGGIPTAAVVTGGKITAFKLEHVWVEAYVDFIPSRGAVNKTGDSWVPMDASFKQYQYTDGMDIKNAVPFDAQGLLDKIKQTATSNETEGWVQNIDHNLVKTTLTDYQSRIKSYISSQKANATVGDVLGEKKIVEQNFPILMGGLPYKLIVSGAGTAILPDSLHHKVSLSLYASQLDRSTENPSMSFSANLSRLAGKRISFTYEPASPADQAVIDSAIETYQTRLPAYLIRVIPTLKVDGVTVATGGVYTMGEKQILSVDMIAPWYQHNRDYQLTAGDFNVLGLNPSGITAEHFNARIKQHDLMRAVDSDYRDYTSEMFHQIALAWWGEKFAFNDFIGATNRIVHYQLPSHALVGTPIKVRYLFGIARSANYGSRVVDAKEDLIMAVHADGNAEQKRRFALAAGHVGSYLEAGIFDQAFLMDAGHSMSTVTALKAASEQGVAVYSIDAKNASSLDKIATAPDDLQTMRDAVAAGLRVTTAQRDITVDNFTGLGYILEDPATGAASYLISGGRNGGDSPTGQTVYPLPQAPASPIFGLILGSSLRQAGATLVAEAGVITGIELPELVPVAGEVAALNPYSLLIMALIVSLIILSTQASVIESKYPRISQVYRHYTTSFAKPLILASQLILASDKTADFGPGVYTVEPPDADITCPITSGEIEIIHDRYNIHDKKALRDSYVEIEITRAGYWNAVINEQLNSKNAVETIFRLPFLYFGPFSVAIEYHSDC